MSWPLATVAYGISVWLFPVLIAVTFHEAAHGFVAHLLALFNLLPLLPLDGGRILVGALPGELAVPLSRLEPYGFPILIGLLFILPVLGAQIGLNLDFISRALSTSTYFIVNGLLQVTGNAQ